MEIALDPSAWGLLILTGGFIGLCFGLFGQAGGLALAPALLIMLPLCGVTAEAAPRLAVTTALAILIPVTSAKRRARPPGRRSIGTSSSFLRQALPWVESAFSSLCQKAAKALGAKADCAQNG